MTAFEDAYDATQSILDAASAASTTSIISAPSNYGTNFRITPGDAVYQVQVSPEPDYPTSNVSYPRAIVVAWIHHYVTDITNEEAFLHSTMFQVAERMLARSVWIAESGIYGLEPDVDPELGDGEREGNVISFELSASVLMDPA